MYQNYVHFGLNMGPDFSLWAGTPLSKIWLHPFFLKIYDVHFGQYRPFSMTCLQYFKIILWLFLATQLVLLYWKKNIYFCINDWLFSLKISHFFKIFFFVLSLTQGSEKVSFGRPQQVDFPAGQVTFQSCPGKSSAN